MHKNDNTQEHFNRDLIIGEITEQYCVNKYQENCCPLTNKIKGNHKIHDIVVPERGYTVEIKTDLESHNTENFFIEFEYRGNPSGIAVTNAPRWFISNGIRIWDIKTSYIKEKCEEYGYNIGYVGGNNNNAKGYLIPMEEFNGLQFHTIPLLDNAHYDYLIRIKRGEINV